MTRDKDGDFIDPELKKDRFDFNVEPLTDDDIKSTKVKESSKGSTPSL